MNGLKYIRTKNAIIVKGHWLEAMGVSRQAINMWENSLKSSVKRERKEDLCNISRY